MSPDQINQFFSFLYEGKLGEITFWLRFAAGIIASALAAVLIIVIIKYRQLLSGAPAAPPISESALAAGEKANQPWEEVMKKIDSSHPADWNLAVIRADSILDEVLKSMGLGGETMGERLKQLDRSRLASLDGVWEAHKIRNRIVHETDRVMTYQEARRAVMLLAEALGELGYPQQ